MDNQIIIVCDEEGKLTGEYIAKEKGHLGKGQRHLAITVLLFNNQGQVLLQKRKHKVFDDIWDLTGATHPLHLKNDHDETFEEATLRCLKREYGIEAEEVKNLKNLGVFNYFAECKDGLCEHEAQPLLCENEHCAMLT
ncbi:MAG: NUDIX domain-containing protein, partial [Armatimonadetes bacterium]